MQRDCFTLFAMTRSDVYVIASYEAICFTIYLCCNHFLYAFKNFC